MNLQTPAPVTKQTGEPNKPPAPPNRFWLGLSVSLNLLLLLLLLTGLWQHFAAKDKSGEDISALPSYGIYKSFRRPPIEMYRNREEFVKRIYASPGEWDPDVEILTVGVIAPPYNEAGLRLLRQIPEVSPDTQGIVALYKWFVSRKWNAFYNSFREAIGTRTVHDNIFCDQAVRFFRTVLKVRGFISRAVVFQYDDGYGKNSHTFMEVFDPSQSKWLFFDPYYYLHSERFSVAELINGRNQPSFDPLPGDGKGEDNLESTRHQLVESVFRKGWHLWYVENAVRGNRIEYRNPEIYPPPEKK